MRRVRDWLRPARVGLLVAVIVLALLNVPGWVLRLQGPASLDPPRFPSTIASYSWHTNSLADGEMEAASLLYQNGVGVEFGDSPMAVLLGADGATYRRLAQAEARSTPMDQGDPGPSVLSPDGTFVVIGSSGATGDIDVVTLRDGHRRTLSVGDGRTAMPAAIGPDSQTVLLAVSDEEVNRYAEGERLGLASIDLATGRMREYPGISDVGGAALSPDGNRIAIIRGDTFEVIDADSGRRITQLPVEIERDSRCYEDEGYEDEGYEDETVDDGEESEDGEEAETSPDAENGATADDASEDDDGYTCPELSLDGDAWSPDGRWIAATLGTTVLVADFSGAEPSLRRLPLETPDYWGAVLGWRDDSTVLVHAPTDGDANNAELLWVDVVNGSWQTFATYRPNFTGAAMASVDAARDLIPRWQVESRPVDRGPLPWWAALLRAVAAGLLAMLLTAVVRRRLLRPGAPH